MSGSEEGKLISGLFWYAVRKEAEYMG